VQICARGWAGNLIKDEMANAEHKIIANVDETWWQHVSPRKWVSLDKKQNPNHTTERNSHTYQIYERQPHTHISTCGYVCV